MKIFLASSIEELKHERDYIAGVVWYLDRLLLDLGAKYQVKLVKCEYLDPSMSVEHKQIQYNQNLANCDATVVLFWRKFGGYTESEFQTALHGVRSGGSPRRLSVLFKETGDEVSPELAAYRDYLVDDYGIKPKRFSSDEELRDRFLEIVFATIKDEDPFFNVPTKATLVKYGLA